METVVNEEPLTPAPEVVEEVTETKPQPGEKTDSALLLKSLQQEREEKRIERDLRIAAEKRLQELENSGTDVYSDEGKALLKKIGTLESEIGSLKGELTLKDVYVSNPIIKEHAEKFEEFRSNPDNAGMSLKALTKVFLVENDLVESPKPRKGLESSSGGGRAPVSTGMSTQEIEDLRVNNYNEYAKRIRNGTLK